MNRIWKFALLFLGGLVYAASFPLPFTFKGQFFLPVLAMGLFFYYLIDSENSLIEDIKSLLIFSLGYYLLGFYWVSYTIDEFGEIPVPFNHILGLGLVLFILPQYLTFIVGKHFIKYKKIKLTFKQNIFFKNINLALIFSLLEYFIPQQFPAHAGHSWMNLAPYLGFAPWLGLPVYSFFNFWSALSLVNYIKTKKKDYLGWVSYLLFFVFNFLFPLNYSTEISDGKTTHIRLVQANIGNFTKVDSKEGGVLSLDHVRKAYYQLSTLPGAAPLDLIIWPETAYPLLLNTDKMKISNEEIPFVIRKVIQDTNAEIFMGGFAARGDNRSFFETEYNSAFFFGKNEGTLFKDYYHKMKLIPFGEKLPFGFLNEFLSRYVENISYFATGNRFTLFKTRDDVRFISAICYEILFPRFIGHYLNQTKIQAHFIVNLTNDSWYGDTSEPHQHLFLAKWRAVEFDIPVVRMTNTGITSIIFPDGSESRRSSIYKKEILDIPLTVKDRQKTPYQKYGIWALILFVALLNGVFFVGMVLKRNYLAKTKR